MKRHSRKPLVAALAVVAGIFAQGLSVGTTVDQPAVNIADVNGLKSAITAWQATYEKRIGADRLRISLGYSKGLSTRRSAGRGMIEIDIRSGTVHADVRDLAVGEYDVWLVDNRPGANQSVKPERGDGFARIGTLAVTEEAAHATLNALLARDVLTGFMLDEVVVTSAGRRPDEEVVIVGAPGLLERLYFSEKSKSVVGVNVAATTRFAAQDPLPFAFLLPQIAAAAANPQLDAVLGAQVARGRDLFVNETFGGNGRTCATCHRLDNNHTIDPSYIAKLPASDPLFVAERIPALEGLENATLLRQQGLVLTHLDGFEQAPVMRSVPHTLALPTSIDTEAVDFPYESVFANALGWSGDGAPGSGSLREFTIGAITQHLPKTLNRVAGVDFRLPTAEELTAIEAYLLSLGRAKDYNLAQLTFTSPIVQRGKLLFDTKQNPVVNGEVVFGQTANCNGCHENAGARSSTTGANPTRDTGVEKMADQPARILDPNLAIDGGFGVEPHDPCGPFTEAGHPCLGDLRFNTPPLVEAADTAPFFHNHSVSTIEEAVAFYNTDAFNQSPGALTSSGKDRRVKLSSSQVTAVALFLRSLNAMENIRNSNRLDVQAAQLSGATARDLIRQSIADTVDAIEVLEGGGILPYTDATKKFTAARLLMEVAALSPSQSLRNSLLQQALDKKRQGVASMVSCDPATVGPVIDPDKVYSCEEMGL